MSDELVSVGFGDLLALLAGFCNQRRSGTMFIVTPDNHSARFVLERGEIVACSYSVKNGHDALPLLRNIKECSYRFADDVFSSISELPMPPTDKCLLYLRGESVRSAAQPKPEERNASAAVDVVKEELTRVIGPVAGIIVDRYIGQSGTPDNRTALSELIGAMAGEVGNETKARDFTDAVAKRIH